MTKRLLVLVMGIFFNFMVSLSVFAYEFIIISNNKIKTIGQYAYLCSNDHCNHFKGAIQHSCDLFGWMDNHVIPIGDKNCFCLCSYETLSILRDRITLLEQISLIFQLTKSLQRLITTLRKNINTLDLDTLKTMLINMKQDLTEIQAVTSNQVTKEGWQEIYEYIDNVIKLNPAVDSKSNIHKQIEATLKLIESKSASISKSLAELEAKIYLETREILNQASATERKYFLPQLEAIHNANQKIINH